MENTGSMAGYLLLSPEISFLRPFLLYLVLSGMVFSVFFGRGILIFGFLGFLVIRLGSLRFQGSGQLEDHRVIAIGTRDIHRIFFMQLPRRQSAEPQGCRERKA